MSENVQSAKDKRAQAGPGREPAKGRAQDDEGRKARAKARQESVTVSSKLRNLKAHAWFNEAAAQAKAAAIEERRRENRKTGPRLTPGELTAVADDLEKVQRELNPLLEKKEELSAKLVAHWAHTGVTEIEGGKGKTLITVSASLGVDPRPVEAGVSKAKWYAITRRELQAPLMLELAMKEKEVQSVIGEAIVATDIKVAVKPPSSRTAKKGDSRDADE